MIILRKPIEEEHIYSIITDIKSSGIKRTLKKTIGNGRRSLAKRLDKSIEKDLIKKLRSERKGAQISETLQNNLESVRLAEDKIKDLQNRGIIVHRGGTMPEVSCDYKSVKFPRFVSAGEVGHEEGHILNAEGKNGQIAKFINEQGQKEKTINEIRNLDLLEEYPELSTRSGRKILLKSNRDFEKELNEFYEDSNIKDTGSRFIRGSALVKDEITASTSGLKSIKNKISKETFKLERQRQKAANNSYKHAVSASSKIPLRNKIQIPSKKGNFEFKKLGEELRK